MNGLTQKHKINSIGSEKIPLIETNGNFGEMRTQSECLNYIGLNHNSASGKPVFGNPTLKSRFAKVVL